MKTYLKMKETSVPWLGKIPEHWDSKRLRFLFSMYTGISVTKDELKEEGIPCIGYGAIHSKYTFDLDLRRDALSCADASFETAKPTALLNENDFVFCDTSEDVEGSGNCVHVFHLAGSKLLAGSHTVKLSPIEKMHARYIAYLFKVTGWKAQVQCQVTGTKVYSISQSILKDTLAVLPPLDEQRAIATYLDKTTAKLDGLIAAQEHLIELLAEKRKALISHVVTKGLNSKAKFKDTTVSWIGKIPEHWEIRKLKYCATLSTDKATSGSANQIALENIEGWTGRFLETISVFEADGISFQKDDVLFGKLRPYLAKVYLADTNGAAVGDFFVLRPGRNIIPQYLATALRTDLFIDVINSSTYGSKMPRVSWDYMGNLLFPLPPLDEQRAIAAYLEKATAKLDALAAKAEEAIDLMKERRSALISAVVTGKVKVS